MRFPFKRPQFDTVAGEYVLPVRFSEEFTHGLLAGWQPMGFGWVHAKSRDDGTFDLWLKADTLSEDLNLVKLDAVRNSLMAAVDLAQAVEESEDSDETLLHLARVIKAFASGAMT